MAFLDGNGLAELWSLIGTKYGVMFEHHWSVLSDTAKTIYVEHQTEAWTSYSNIPLTDGATWSIPYADSVTVNPATGEITLNNPTTHTATGASDAEKADLAYKVRGKYITNANFDKNNVYFIPYGTSITYAGNVSIQPSSYAPIYRVEAVRSVIPEGEATYVHSTDRNAYPDSGTLDGLTYTYLGVPLNNAATALEITVGSYAGTGVHGKDNPNVLTFDFAPRFVWILGGQNAYGEWSVFDTETLVLMNILTTEFTAYRPPAYSNDSKSYSRKSEDGKTLEWYYDSVVTSDSSKQLNHLNTLYHYIAIG